jgi:hypothetical protein
VEWQCGQRPPTSRHDRNTTARENTGVGEQQQQNLQRLPRKTNAYSSFSELARDGIHGKRSEEQRRRRGVLYRRLAR